MDKKFNILNEAVAKAAIKEGAELGLNPKCKETENGFELSYASYDSTKETKDYVSYSDMDYYMKSVSYEIKYIREDLSYLWKKIDEHKKGHIPAIKDAGKMEAALKALGLADSYDVQKPTVWAEY